MKHIFTIMISCLIAFTACKPGEKTTSRQAKNKHRKKILKYEEDLSVLRPSYLDSVSTGNKYREKEKIDTLADITIEPEYDVTAEINNFLEQFSEKKKNEDIRLYTLQIFLGSEREDASFYRNKARDIFGTEEVKMLFEAPFYKVRIGRFANRMEAYRDLCRAEAIFENVSLVPLSVEADNFEEL